MTAVLLVATVLLRPSDACYENWDDAWCDAHADALADMPLWADLAVEGAGGYLPGDLVATGWGDSVPAPVEALDAVATAGRRLAEHPTTHDEARLLVDLSACEAGLSLRASNVRSSAEGPWQFLAGIWARVAAATGYANPGSWDDQASNALWLGRHGGWQHWQCLGVVR